MCLCGWGGGGGGLARGAYLAHGLKLHFSKTWIDNDSGSRYWLNILLNKKALRQKEKSMVMRKTKLNIKLINDRMCACVRHRHASKHAHIQILKKADKREPKLLLSKPLFTCRPALFHHFEQWSYKNLRCDHMIWLRGHLPSTLFLSHDSQ